MPTGLIVNSEGWRTVFSMTSGRALMYRWDLTPTADTVWQSGDTANGGRNKGYAYSFSHDSRDYVALIGGCAVRVARDAMHSGTPPGGSLETSLGGTNAHCSIHHHYLWFEIDGPRITRQFNQYYSYSSSDGFFHNRPEFPNNPVGPIGGEGTQWQVYNLFRADPDSTGKGEWWTELLPDPADPTNVRHVNRWYVWDQVDLDADGTSELLATRARSESSENPYVLPWEMDVLRWNGTDLESVYHRDGVAPALFNYPNVASRYADGGRKRAGTITRDVDGDDVREVMVEGDHGERSFLRVPLGP